MKNRLVVALLFATALLSEAQISSPVFKDKTDSTQYSQVQIAIRELVQQNPNSMENRKKFDSLLTISNTLRAKIIGYKVIYKPNDEFTDYRDVLTGKANPKQVTQLSFSNNSLKKLPKEIFECANLKELELVNARVKKLPKKLGKLTQLKSIYVYNHTPKSRLRLGKNSVTEELLIRGTDAARLPKKYKPFTSLRELDLTSNIGLKQFPNISRNANLKKVNLLNNQLTLTDIAKIKHETLDELNMLNNKITRVPESIANFPSLKKLVFSNNPITEIDPAIGQLKKLDELAFYNCKLKELSKGIEELENLRQIDLYYNQNTEY